MTAVQRTLHSARRRLILARFLRALGWSLLAAAFIALAGFLANDFLGTQFPLWTLAIPTGLALLTAAVIALATAPSTAQTAVLLDDRLQLKDALATHLYAQSLPDSELTQQVQADAEKRAATATPKRAAPVALTAVWSYAAVLIAATAAVAFFMPTHNLLAPSPEDLQAEQDQQLTQQTALAAHDTVRATTTALDQLTNTLPEDAPVNDQSFADLRKELDSLTQEDLENPDVRRDAAAKLSDLQDRLDTAHEEKQQELDDLRSNLSQIDPKTPGPADDFANALRRGDFDAAAQNIQELQEQID
ncbi:MAG: hypothetical protein AAF797_15995, partial [Planctomycetota bacterium]